MTTPKPLWKKLIKTLSIIAVILLLFIVALAWYSGAWRVFFPSSDHDTQTPALPADLGSPAVLIFSKTNSFRHTDGINGGLVAFSAIANDNNWSFYATENGAVFTPEHLARFDSVVFLNATGDMLSDDQELAFQNWLEAGGGWLGVHAAGDGSHASWDWYMENLIGARFTAHIMGPQFQRATVMMELPDHPIAKGVPDTWSHLEEWYSWEASPREQGFTVLATLDESSYSPWQKMLWSERDLRMGDHPVVWSNCVGKGRSLYAAMGHNGEAFEQPQYRLILENGLRWIMGGPGGNCELIPEKINP